MTELYNFIFTDNGPLSAAVFGLLVVAGLLIWLPKGKDDD